MRELFDLIANTTSILSILLSIGIIIKFRELNQTLKIVGIYIIVGTAIDIISSALFIVGKSNLEFLHLFTLIEIIVIGKFFQVLFQHLNSHFKIIYFALPIALFVIINSLFIQPIDIYNSYSSALVSISILGFCIYFFYLILDFESNKYGFVVTKWFVYTLFFYHSISLIIMFLGNLITTLEPLSQAYIWTFRALVILATKIILVICFTKLFLQRKRPAIQ